MIICKFSNNLVKVAANQEEMREKPKKQSTHRSPNTLLTQTRCSYLMLIFKAGFEHGRRVCYFPTPLEPSPCDSPPLHPGKLSA